MSSSDTTWRKHPFQKGQTYMVRKSFTGFPGDEFVAGLPYLLVGIAYSHYDSSTIFTFREANKGELVYWWWHDDQPETLCQELFISHDIPS